MRRNSVQNSRFRICCRDASLKLKVAVMYMLRLDVMVSGI